MFSKKRIYSWRLLPERIFSRVFSKESSGEYSQGDYYLEEYSYGCHPQATIFQLDISNIAKLMKMKMCLKENYRIFSKKIITVILYLYLSV